MIGVYLVSLASELLGTTHGIPFGAYSYTALLGPKWFDRVPLLIPLSWFTMAWAVWCIALPWAKGWAAVGLRTALLVAWDILLDPAMSKVTSYWVWGEVGRYYGMPWSNLAGWAITGLVLLALLHRVSPRPHSRAAFSFLVYCVDFLLPLAFCILNGYWLAVLAALTTASVAWLVFSGNIFKYHSKPTSPPTFAQETYPDETESDMLKTLLLCSSGAFEELTTSMLNCRKQGGVFCS